MPRSSTKNSSGKLSLLACFENKSLAILNKNLFTCTSYVRLFPPFRFFRGQLRVSLHSTGFLEFSVAGVQLSYFRAVMFTRHVERTGSTSASPPVRCGVSKLTKQSFYSSHKNFVFIVQWRSFLAQGDYNCNHRFSHIRLSLEYFEEKRKILEIHKNAGMKESRFASNQTRDGTLQALTINLRSAIIF